LMAVLLSRGPDAVLAKGSTVEMITDRPLQFAQNEIDFGVMQPGRFSDQAGAQPSAKKAVWARLPI